MAIHNRHDFYAFPALRCSDFRPATFGHDERRIDEAFFFIQRAFVAKLVGNVRQNPSQNLVAASEDSSKIKFVYQNKLTSDRGGRHQGTPNAARAAYSCINFSKPCQSCGGSSRR